MEQNHDGFGLVQGLLIVVIVIAIGLTGSYVWSQNAGSDQKTTPQIQQQYDDQIKKTESVSITLISAISSKPIANTKVNIQSSNGILCEGDGCNTNNLHWEGVTNDDGVVYVPKENIQRVTTVAAEGYLQASLGSYDEAKTSYEVELGS